MSFICKDFNPLAPGIWVSNFKSVISELMSGTEFMSTKTNYFQVNAREHLWW